MAIHYRTEGYVLGKVDLREADQLFTIYTRDYGKIDVLGRAIRKIKSKLRSGAELLYLSEIEFIQGKAYKTLTDAILINKFKDIKNDLEKTKIACQVAEVLDDLIKAPEPDEKIWNLLNNSLGKLNEPGSLNFENSMNQVHLIYYYFLWNCLSVLGYQIDLYNCVACEKNLIPLKLYFTSEHSGIMCAQCFDKSKDRIDVSPETIKIIRLLLEENWDILSKLKIDDSYKEELEKISEYYLRSLAP